MKEKIKKYWKKLEELEKKQKEIAKENFMNIPIKKSNAGKIIGGMVGFIFGYILYKYLGLIFFFIFLIAVLIGLYFPNWYLKKENVNKSLIKGIAWSNVITWFLPPLGLIVSIATFGFSSSEKIEDRQKYKKLAIVGLTLSIINSFLGAVLTILGVL